MTYDMRGNRDSEGDINTFTRADFIDDAVVAYDYLREQVGPEVHIGVIGSSFGGYTAVLLSTRRDVFCLSLRVPATYPNEGLDEIQAPQGDALKASGWRAKPLTYKQNHAFKAMHDFTGKVQIIEAEKDEQVASQGPRNYADAVANKDNLEYILWHDAPHSLVTPQLREEYEAYLLQWIERVI
jgi:esterase/lipase